MTIPEIISGPTVDSSTGLSYYIVSYDGCLTLQEMTVEQYEYLVASAKAVEQLDQTETVDQTSPTEPSGDTSHGITEAPADAAEPAEEPFIGSMTAYDDNAADTPALFASLPVVDNTFTSIMDWFGDTFFIERTKEVVKTGYTSERYSYNSSTQLIQLPYEETVTETVQVLNPQAVSAAVIVVLTFVTVVTWIKGAIFGRLS